MNQKTVPSRQEKCMHVYMSSTSRHFF